MTYEVVVIIVVINAIATFSLWRKLASKSSRGPILNKKSSHCALAQRDAADGRRRPIFVAGWR
jgi:hypothetical protein